MSETRRLRSAPWSRQTSERSVRSVWHARPGLRYLRRAVVSPWQFVCVGIVAVVAAIHPAIGLFVALPVVELGIVLGLPLLRPFRRTVDRRRAQEAARARGAERDEVLGGMSLGHRAELERLEQLAIVATSLVGDDEQESSSFSARAFDRLLSQYVRAAVAHEQSTRLIERADHSRPERYVTAGARRYAHQRVLRRVENCNHIARLADQLATIAALIELAHERLISPQPLDDIDVEAAFFLQEIETVEDSARAVAALRAESFETRWSALSDQEPQDQ